MMSESGKKTTTVISCTTFETIKVSDPIVFYEADRAHIIYMAEDSKDETNFYVGLVKDIEKLVKVKRDVEFIEHNAVVYRYSEMLRTVNNIIKSEREKYGRFVDIYVNISSGTSEYAAAAMCACMMDPYAIPFTVSVKEHNIPLEKYREMIGEGVPFGDAKSVNPPRMIETFNIEPPEEEMVKYLAFIASLEDRASCHTLRRLFGTTLIENGEDLDVVQSLMRHADISTTLECYKRDNKVRKRAARRRVGRTLLH